MADQPAVVVINAIKKTSVRVTFVAHFILISWGVQGYWSPQSYFFYNFFFLGSLLWSMQARESEDPIFMAFLINLVSVGLDVVVISSYFPQHGGSMERFTVIMAILNLVIRPMSIFVLYHKWTEHISAPTEGTRQAPMSYETIE